jgi:hypothetical protein
MIHILPVISNKDFRVFLRLPKKIYQDDPCYVEPLRMELKKQFHERKNPFFKHAAIQSFLAIREKRVVGRITAIQNQLYNEFHGDRSGFFGFFECIDDREVSRLLFNAAESWIVERGLEQVIGPMSFSTNDISPGFLVKGFEYPPFIEMAHSPPHYPELALDAGYREAQDVLAYRIQIQQEFDPRLVEIAEKVRISRNIVLRLFDPKHMQRDVAILKDIYNSAWEKNWGFVPLTDEEFDSAVENFNRIRIPELAQIAEIEGKPVGFSLSLPNINEVLIRMNGRLFPFGIFKFLLGMKRIKGARLLILGVKPEYRKRGIDAMLYFNQINEGKKLGLTDGELSWVLESNVSIINAAKLVRGVEYKRYRLFQKDL